MRGDSTPKWGKIINLYEICLRMKEGKKKGKGESSREAIENMVLFICVFL